MEQESQDIQVDSARHARLLKAAEVGAEAPEVTPVAPGANPGEYKSGGQEHGGQK